jgi:hypothetical protein
VIDIRPKPDGPGSTYEPTRAVRELMEVLLALQQWGSQWAELTPEHAHPGVVLWGMGDLSSRPWPPASRAGAGPLRLPNAFGAGQPLLAADRLGDAEICERHPGGEEDLVVVVSDPVAFARWHLGELEWSDALRGGAIEVRGPSALARALPTWKRRADRVEGSPAARRATATA